MRANLRVWRLCIALACISAAARTAGVGAGHQNPQVPSFRSAVTLVPVDVRVVDRDGRPVTDLKREDFRILENRVPQQIEHFSVQLLSPEPTGPAAAPPMNVVGAPGLALVPQNRRLFLIVLGRGRLQEPSKGMDAVLRFVRERLLPQDQVAVFAYDRATRFTADHVAIADLLGRFRRLHFGVEALMQQRFAGLAAAYGSDRLPPAIRKEIDRIFDAPAGAGIGPVPPVAPADAERMRKDTRDAADQRLQQMVLEEQAKLGPISPLHTEIEKIENEQFTDLPFDEFVANNAGTMQDLGKIYTAIAYLRHFDGEKHLIFMSEYGMQFLRTDDVDRLAEEANDARVAIDNIQTGGVLGGFRAMDLRYLSRSTGGQASISEYSVKGFDSVDRGTRASYLLGYYPTVPVGDGKYRRIDVRVNRQGVTAFFRHGYYARVLPPTFDRRAAVTDNRVMSAAMYGGNLSDIAVTAEASEVKSADGTGKDIVVKARIDASRVSLQPVHGTRRGFLDVVVFVADTRKVVVGEKWQQIDMNLSDASHARLLQEGIPYTLRLPKPGRARIVKLVVYDYQADLLGSVEVEIK